MHAAITAMQRRIAFLAAGAAAFAPRPHALRVRRAPRATAVEQLKPYSNTCGLFALAPSEMSALAEYRRAIAAATAQHPPAYD